MKNAVTLPIDADMLRRCLELRGYKLEAASLMMGFGRSYLNQVLSRGTVTPSGAKLIETQLGIGFDMYKKEEAEVEAEPEEVVEEPDCNCEVVSELREIKELLRQILEVWS